MAMTSSGSTVPSAGGDAVPGGYPAPTPHAAKVDQTPYEAPSSVPSDHPAMPSASGLEAIDGLGAAKQL